MKTKGKYILDKKGNPVVETDLMKWAEWMEKSKNRILKQTKIDEYFVSTVFLALDYSLSGTKPMLWETMVWKDDKDIYQERHGTKDVALLAHKRVVTQIKNGQELT